MVGMRKYEGEDKLAVSPKTAKTNANQNKYMQQKCWVERGSLIEFYDVHGKCEGSVGK